MTAPPDLAAEALRLAMKSAAEEYEMVPPLPSAQSRAWADAARDLPRHALRRPEREGGCP